HEIAAEHFVYFRAQHIGKAAGHSGAEVQPHRAENKGQAAGHVFTAVLAHAFDYGESAAVANGKTLSGAARDVELAGCRAIEHGVSGKHIAAPRSSSSRRNSDRPTG